MGAWSLPMSITMNRYLKFLRGPLNSFRTTGIILSDGAREVRKKMKYVFGGGPVSELSEYVQMIKRFLRSKAKKLHSLFSATKERLTDKSKSQSDGKKVKRSSKLQKHASSK